MRKSFCVARTSAAELLRDKVVQRCLFHGNVVFDYGKQSCGKLLNGNIVNVVRLGYDMVARHGAMANTAKIKLLLFYFYFSY